MGKGIAILLTSSVTFCFLYYYVTLMAPLDGFELYALRTVLLLPLLYLFMWLRHETHLFYTICHRLKASALFAIPLFISASLIGLQQWLFMWAPLNGQALNASLGFFLLPLMMVLVGKFFYKEPLSLAKKIAVGAATLGVANAVWHNGGLSWVTLVVALGYPPYFMVRKYFDINHLGGLIFDMIFMLPVAFWIFAQSEHSLFLLVCERPSFALLILCFGLLSTICLGCYIIASSMLPMSVFGLVTYLEPVLLVVVSYVLGESISFRDVPTYACIGLALVIMGVEGLRAMQQSRHVRPAKHTRVDRT